MEIVSRKEENKVTMEISGWLDTQTAPELEKVLLGLDDSVTSLIFDFGKLEYYFFSRTASGDHCIQKNGWKRGLQNYKRFRRSI